LTHFQAAIDADPRSALAHSGLADAYALLVYYSVLHPVEGVSKAKAAAIRAIQLDPMLAESYATLALISSHHDGKWEKAESLYRKAIILNPGYAIAHHWLGVTCLALVGRFDDALEEIEMALELDPLFSNFHQGRGLVSLFKREYQDAVRIYREILESDPTFYGAFDAIGRAYIQMGNYSEALAMLQKGRSFRGDVPHILAAIGQALALSNDTAGARGVLAQLQARSRNEYVPSTCFAVLHLGLRENEKALDWLEKACEEHEMSAAALRVHPIYDELRRESRFLAVLEKLGLANP
jgi:serine/threonine-protein kinase